MEPRQCKASSKQSGKRCQKPASPGSMVCAAHGSKAPQARRAAQERVVEQEARRTFGRLEEVATPIDNPLEALAGLAGEVVAWKDFCAGRIADLERLGTQDFKGAEQIDAVVALFERAMDRCVSTMTAIARLNIDERLAAVSEAQQQLMAELFRDLLGDEELGLTEKQREAAPHVLARHLSALAG